MFGDHIISSRLPHVRILLPFCIDHHDIICMKFISRSFASQSRIDKDITDFVKTVARTGARDVYDPRKTLLFDFLEVPIDG